MVEKALLTHLKLEIDLDNKNILDLGCAQGWFERSLFERGIYIKNKTFIN